MGGPIVQYQTVKTNLGHAWSRIALDGLRKSHRRPWDYGAVGPSKGDGGQSDAIYGHHLHL